jgi:putative addiction module CopG family antidote
MNISLPKKFRNFVKERVDRGEYRSASAVIRAGLLLLQESILERDKRQGDHDNRMWELKKKHLKSLDISVDDVQRWDRAPKPRKAHATQRMRDT